MNAASGRVLATGIAILAVGLAAGGAVALLVTHATTDSRFSHCDGVADPNARVKCLVPLFRGAIRTDGLRVAERETDRVARQDGKLRESCHLAWHSVGGSDGAADARSRRRPATVEATSGMCAVGYEHGYMIGYYALTPLPVLTRLATADCSSRDDVIKVSECFHAFGHSLYERTRNVGLSDGMCMRLRTTGLAVYARTLCAKGVFMQQALDEIGHHADPASDQCLGISPDLMRVTCYEYRTGRFALLDPTASQAEGGRACTTVSWQPGRVGCLRSYGSVASGSPDEACGIFDRRADREACADGARLNRGSSSGYVRSQTASRTS